MINYGQTKSTTRPQEIEVTSSTVFVASNITPYEKEVDGIQESGYTYNYVSYDKDEYLIKLSQENKSLQEELSAAKILLGVD